MLQACPYCIFIYIWYLLWGFKFNNISTSVYWEHTIITPIYLSKFSLGWNFFYSNSTIVYTVTQRGASSMPPSFTPYISGKVWSVLWHCTLSTSRDNSVLFQYLYMHQRSSSKISACSHMHWDKVYNWLFMPMTSLIYRKSTFMVYLSMMHI